MEVVQVRVRGKDVAVGVALVVFAAALVRDVRVPILGYVDLGFHELGHLLAYPLPPLFTAMAGSLAQTLIPLGLAAYFMFNQYDRTGAAFCLGWAGTNAADVARYIADAPFERLPLLGGEHDWAFVLSEVDQMHRAGLYATIARLAAWLMLSGAVFLLATRYVRRWIENS